LSLTKFLIVTDGDINIENFKELWVHVLERVNWQRDLFIFANVSQDTLDYTGPSVNNGSKALLMGLGKQPRVELPCSFQGSLPQGCDAPQAYLPGTLVVQGSPYEADKKLPETLAECSDLQGWPIVILVDNVREATESMQEFIWTFFTRFEPAADIYSASKEERRFHVGVSPPVVFDCRMKPWYPDVLEVDEKTKALVDEKINTILPGHLQ